MLSLCAKLVSLIPEIIYIVHILSTQSERHEIRKRKKNQFMRRQSKQEKKVTVTGSRAVKTVPGILSLYTTYNDLLLL